MASECSLWCVILATLSISRFFWLLWMSSSLVVYSAHLTDSSCFHKRLHILGLYIITWRAISIHNLNVEHTLPRNQCCMLNIFQTKNQTVYQRHQANVYVCVCFLQVRSTPTAMRLRHSWQRAAEPNWEGFMPPTQEKVDQIKCSAWLFITPRLIWAQFAEDICS